MEATVLAAECLSAIEAVSRCLSRQIGELKQLVSPYSLLTLSPIQLLCHSFVFIH